MPSIAKFDVWKNGAGNNYNVPIQVVTSSLGTDLGTTDSATSDRTQNQVPWSIVTNTTTWTDTSNLQLTITPKFSNSLIKLGLAITLNNNGNNNAAGIRVRRGNKIVFRPMINTTGPISTGYTTAGGNQWFTFFYEFYDSPATTSPVTYTLQYRAYSSAFNVVLFSGANNGDYAGANYLTATEIAQ